MKKFITTDFGVGIMALAALLALIYMSLEVNDRGAVGRSPKNYQAKFKSVSGLVLRTPVEISGIIVGFVDDIKLDGTQGAIIGIKMQRQLDIREDASLSMLDRGILGDKFLNLFPGSQDKPELSQNGFIQANEAGGGLGDASAAVSKTAQVIQDVLKSDNPEGALGETISNLRDATANMNQLILDNQSKLNVMLGNMTRFSSDMAQISARNKEDISRILVAMRDFSESLRSSFTDNGGLSSTTNKLNETLSSTQNILQKIERGEGTVGKLLNDETTVNQINEAVENLNSTLGLASRVQLGVRYRGEYLTDQQELQSLIGVKLAPSPDKHILLEMVAAPQGETTVTDTIVTSNGSPVSSTQTISTDDRILFNAQFAKRFWDSTIRVGMMRNEGGIGLDQHLLKDQLTLSAEAFNFSRFEDRAQVRAYATLNLFKHFLLTGGVDDIITKSNQRNMFFGAGLQFTDHDFKALLPSLGAIAR